MQNNSPKGAHVSVDSVWGQNRELARSLLIKSRLYRFFALAFALIGVVVFLILYFKNVEGRLFEALMNPSIIAMILIPFLPAIVLSLMAQHLEQKFMKLAKPEEASAPSKK